MELRPYQQRAIQFLGSQKRALLSIDMRLGKTAIVLHHVNIIKPETLLIVAPKRVINNSWIQEAEKWGLHELASKMVVVDGSPSKRARLLSDNSKPYKLISRDNVSDLSGSNFDIIVIDEITSFKSVLASRSQAIRSITARQYIGLTGTFLANGAIDIFGQMAALKVCSAVVHYTSPKRSKPKAYCPSFDAWRAEYFIDKMAGSGRQFAKWTLRGDMDDVIEPFRKHIFTLDAADYNVLAKSELTMHEVTLTPIEYRNYLNMSAMLPVKIQDEYLSVSEEARFAKLQTLCNGFVYDTCGHAIRGPYSTKLESVADFCQSAKEEGERVLLFYAFREEAIWLSEKLKSRGLSYCSVKEKRFVDIWNNREVDVLMMHPGSSFGLNLQLGGRIIVWSSITYNYEYWDQANARLSGAGQTSNVSITVFSAAETIEHQQYKAIKKKMKENKLFKKITKC